MRVWLKGFNSTFKCPAVINVWKVLWVYMKFCDIKDSALSAFSSFKICVTLSLLLHVSHRHASFTHVNYNSHLTLKMHSNYFFYISLSLQAWFYLSFLSRFISVSRSNFRWVLHQMCATDFICELKEPPAGHVFIFSWLVMWMENNLSLGYRLHKIPSLCWLLSFHRTNFHIQFNGFPSETITPTLTKFKWDSIGKLMWSELFCGSDESNICVYWI